MRLGIVGHGQEKFTEETERLARQAMLDIARDLKATSIVSGHSPMGGVDWWAEDLAKRLKLELVVHAPTRSSWEGKGGFRERNLKIAEDSDTVLCVVVEKLPKNFKGRRFKDCYHCKGRNPVHVKSGGCWTAWECKNRLWRIV